jgi:hypothetical protein
LLTTWIDVVLAVTFVALNLEPMRSAVGRTTGLWSSCARNVGDNASTEAWSPWILALVAVPASLTFVLAEVADVSPGRRRASRIAAGTLLILVGLGVVVATATCIE